MSHSFEKEPSVLYGWIVLVCTLCTVFFLMWMFYKKTAPQPLFAPHYEQPESVPSAEIAHVMR
jgi:hypothetical protein